MLPRSNPLRVVVLLVVVLVLATRGRAAGADDSVNFESGHTCPLALSPDGALLFEFHASRAGSPSFGSDSSHHGSGSGLR